MYVRGGGGAGFRILATGVSGVVEGLSCGLGAPYTLNPGKGGLLGFNQNSLAEADMKK